MAHLDLEGWGMCLAPPHRRLRDPAIAPWMADTATTAHPKSRRRSVAAADPAGSSPPDQMEVLHHCGRSDDPAFPTFECTVNGAEAIAWLDENRPDVAAAIRSRQANTAHSG